MATLIWAVISHQSTTVSSLGIPMSRQLSELPKYLHNESLSKPDRRATSYERKSPNATCFGCIVVVVQIRFSCRDLGTASIATIHMWQPIQSGLHGSIRKHMIRQSLWFISHNDDLGSMGQPRKHSAEASSATIMEKESVVLHDNINVFNMVCFQNAWTHFGHLATKWGMPLMNTPVYIAESIGLFIRWIHRGKIY